MASTWGRPRRVRVTWVRCERLAQGGLKLRPTRQQGEHAGRRDLVQHQAQHLQRGGVGPVQVFPHRQDGLPLRLLQQPGHQGFVRLLPLPLGRQVQGRIMRPGRGTESSAAKSGMTSSRGNAIRPQHLLQCVELRLGSIVALPVQDPLQVVDHRVEGTVLVIGGTAKHHARGALAADPLAQHLHQARFANARLATAAAPPGPCRPGSAPSAPGAAATSDSRPTRGVKPLGPATSRRLCAALSPSMRYTWTGAATPLRLWAPRSWARKVAPHQAEGGGTDHDRIRRRQPLEAGRHDWASRPAPAVPGGCRPPSRPRPPARYGCRSARPGARPASCARRRLSVAHRLAPCPARCAPPAGHRLHAPADSQSTPAGHRRDTGRYGPQSAG